MFPRIAGTGFPVGMEKPTRTRMVFLIAAGGDRDGDRHGELSHRGGDGSLIPVWVISIANLTHKPATKQGQQLWRGLPFEAPFKMAWRQWQRGGGGGATGPGPLTSKIVDNLLL